MVTNGLGLYCTCRPNVVARSYIDKLVNGPQLKASDIDGLSRLALEMQKCEITLSQLGFFSDVDNSENLRRIVKCLPMYLRTKWVDVAYLISKPVRGTNPGREARFSDLANLWMKNHVSLVQCTVLI